MATDTIQEFLVGLGFKVDENSFSTAENNLSSFSNSVSGAIKVVGGLITAIAGLSAVKGVLNFANEIDDFVGLGNRVNATSEQLEELAYVAELTGSSTASLTSSIEALSNEAGDTFRGIGRAKVIFEKLGISVKDSNGELKSSYDLLFEIGDSIKNLSRGEQTSAIRRLGIDPTLLKLITEDTSGLRDEFATLRAELGLSGEASAEAADALTNVGIKFRLTIHEIKKAIASKFFVSFGELIDGIRLKILKVAPPFVKLFEEARDSFEKLFISFSPALKIIEFVGDGMLRLGRRALQASLGIIDAVAKVNDALGGWPAKILGIAVSLGALGIALKVASFSARLLLTPLKLLLVPFKILPALIALMFSPLKTLTALWSALNVAISANPIGIVITLLTALGVALLALYDDFKTFKEGGDSQFNWDSFIETLEKVKLGLKIFIGYFTSVFKTISWWFTKLFGWADRLKSASFFDISLDIFKNLISWVKDAAGWVGVLGDKLLDLVGLPKKLQFPNQIKLDSSVSQPVDSETFGVLRQTKETGKENREVEALRNSIRGAINPIRLASPDLSFASKEKSPVFSSPSTTFANNNSQTKTSQVINNKTEIKVTGGGEPKQTAREIEKAQIRVNEATARNFAGAVR